MCLILGTDRGACRWSLLRDLFVRLCDRRAGNRVSGVGCCAASATPTTSLTPPGDGVQGDCRMSRVTVQFVGSGDAFGSGGRFQACISVRSAETHVLLDCGASSLVALKRLGLRIPAFAPEQPE